MTCYFTSFSTVFLSYQDDGWVIMRGCVQWNPSSGTRTRDRYISRPKLNPLNYWGSSYRIVNHIDFKELISMFWPCRGFVWDLGTHTSSESGFPMTRLRNCLIHCGNAVPAIYVITLLFYCLQGYRNFLLFSLPKMSLQRP